VARKINEQSHVLEEVKELQQNSCVFLIEEIGSEEKKRYKFSLFPGDNSHGDLSKTEYMLPLKRLLQFHFRCAKGKKILYNLSK